MRLTPEQFVAIGFEPETRDGKSKSDTFAVSERSVSRAITSVAYCNLLSLVLLCSEALKGLEAAPPSWALTAPMWDETREKLKFTFQGRSIAQVVLALSYNTLHRSPFVMAL